MLQRIHHVNFVVRDLDDAVARYERILGVRSSHRDALPARGALTARFQVGDAWLVLVQPVGDGAPARHLAEHGEGFFLISFGVDDLDAAMAAVKASGGSLDGEPRLGLDSWRVVDLGPDTLPGALVQLCQDR